MKTGLTDSIQFITGVEISAGLPPEYGFKGSAHVLGYGVELEDPCLNKTLGILQDARKNRNPRIIEKLNALNIPVTIDDVTQIASDHQAGRPHIAKALVDKGYADSISEAFDRYLGVGQPAYVDKYRISCEKAIEVINNAGGIAVLAHPYLLKPNRGADFENLLLFLKSHGLSGIEAYYSEHSPDITRYYKEMADKHHLLTTGGSDYHGSIRPDIQMGSGTGSLHVPHHVYKQLVETIQKRKQATGISKL